jgi:hypothetical protein
VREPKRELKCGARGVLKCAAYGVFWGNCIQKQVACTCIYAYGVSTFLHLHCIGSEHMVAQAGQ